MRAPKHPPDFQELLRTRIEDLAKATIDPRYNELVREVQRRYRHWDKLTYIARQESPEGHSHDPELVWLMAKMARMSQYRFLPFRGPRGEEVKYSVPDDVQRELMQIDRELGGSLTSSDERPLDQTQRERFIINAFREEAIASSMLEGATTTRRVAKEMLRSGRDPRNKGERMVLNNYRAIQFVREHQTEPLSTDLLIELQRILTEDTLDKPSECGRLRMASDDVVVADPYDQVLHEPPAAGELRSRLGLLCDFANNPESDDRFIHPVIRACALHFQIGVDHPFCDGNGRTARAVFYWYMLRRGYWLFEYLPISRLIYQSPSQYARAFLYSETDEYDFTYFLSYSAKITARAREDLHEYIKRKQQETATARRVFARDSSLNHRQREVVMRAMRNPDRVFTIAEHQGEFRVAYGTANTDLQSLVDHEYLTRLRSGNKYEFVRGPKLENIENQIS